MKHKLKGKIAICLLIAIIIAGAAFSAVKLIRYMYPLEYRELIEKYSDEYDLDPYLVLAVIKVESSFRPDAVSPRDARGLMQITGKTGEWIAGKLKINNYSKDMLFEPEMNIRIGCWYLSTLYYEFGDLELMLVAYNAGSGNVSQWLKNNKYSQNGKSLDKIPFKETEQYLIKVKKSQATYKKLYESEF